MTSVAVTVAVNSAPAETARCAKRGLTCGDTGAPGGIRTPNLLIRSQMLYPLSHGCRLRPAGRSAGLV
jgi:hypothetical protein